jgi:hypothetical protein
MKVISYTIKIFDPAGALLDIQDTDPDRVAMLSTLREMIMTQSFWSFTVTKNTQKENRSCQFS